MRLASFDLPGEDLLPATTQETVFRITQEAFSNVAGHARARAVAVEVGTHDDSIILEVRDDGQGFDPACAMSGLGLAGMRARAQSVGGNVELESVPGRGTLVRVHIPLRRPPPVGAETQKSNRLRQDRENAIKLCTFMEQVSAVLIFLGTPISAVVLGAAVSLVLYGRARFVGAQLAVRPDGVQMDDIRNHYQEQGLVAGALGIIGLCVLYFLVAGPSWGLQLPQWLVIGLAVAIEGSSCKCAAR